MKSLVISVAIAAWASSADAQLVNGKWQPPKSGGSAGTQPRQGVQAKKPATQPTVVSNTSIVVLRVIPALVMSDGSILADFGAGLEVVSHSCPSGASSMPLRVVGSLPPAPQLQPVPQMQPAPSMSTPSQQTLPSAQIAAAHQAAQASCHLRDANGRVFATR